MSNTNIKVIDKENALKLVYVLVFGGIAAGLPFMIHIQWITGPIVNALLILTLFLVDLRAAILVSLVPSIMALSSGLLPAVLAPAVPFIMFSNVLFVMGINYLYEKFKNPFNGFVVAAFTSSMLKFLFLLFSVNTIAKLLSSSTIAVKVAQPMGWPQFYTAIAGSFIAFVVLKFLKRI